MDTSEYRKQLEALLKEITEAKVHFSGNTSTNRLTKASIYAATILDDNVKEFSKKSSCLSWVMVGLTVAMLILIVVQVLIAKGCI